MKNEPVDLDAKSPRERFAELGTKVLAVTKEEMERREKSWQQQRRKPKQRKR